MLGGLILSFVSTKSTLITCTIFALLLIVPNRLLFALLLAVPLSMSGSYASSSWVVLILIVSIFVLIGIAKMSFSVALIYFFSPNLWLI